MALDDRHVVFAMSLIGEAHLFLSQGRWLRILGLGHDEALEVPALGGVIGLVRQCHEARKT